MGYSWMEYLYYRLTNLHFINTRAYGAIAPEPLGCASHSYLTEESVTDKRTNKQTNEHTSPIINTDCLRCLKI